MSTAGCVPAATLTFTNQTWTCTRPLASYGTLPLRVVMNYTNNQTAFGVRLGAGCVGDSSSSSIDLILDIRGNGQTFGTADDAIRIMNELPGASNIQITGQANCGKKQSIYHQDGVHAIGGTNITFVDFTIGNYDAGVATCQGAGGMIFYSGAPRNLNVVRGKFIGCNHGLLDGVAPASGSVVGAMFRTGRFDMATGLCEEGNSGRPYSASPACLTSNPMVTQSGLTCQRWNPRAGQWVNQ